MEPGQLIRTYHGWKEAITVYAFLAEKRRVSGARRKHRSNDTTWHPVFKYRGKYTVEICIHAGSHTLLWKLQYLDIDTHVGYQISEGNQEILRSNVGQQADVQDSLGAVGYNIFFTSCIQYRNAECIAEHGGDCCAGNQSFF